MGPARPECAAHACSGWAHLLAETAAKLKEWYELPSQHRSGTELQLSGLVPLAAVALRSVATVLDGSDDVEVES